MPGTLCSQVTFQDTEVAFQKFILLPIDSPEYTKKFANQLSQYMQQCSKYFDTDSSSVLTGFKTKLFTLSSIYHKIPQLSVNNGLRYVSIPIAYLYKSDVVLVPISEGKEVEHLIMIIKNIISSNLHKHDTNFYYQLEKLVSRIKTVVDIYKFGGKITITRSLNSLHYTK